MGGTSRRNSRLARFSPDNIGVSVIHNVFCRHVPCALFDRPKMGFGVPIDLWLRGPLRDWAEALLSEARLRNEGFLDAGSILRRWREHLDLRNDWRDSLWGG